MPTIDINKLKTLSGTSKLNSAERKTISDTVKEVQVLERKLRTIEANQKNKAVLEKNPVVKKMLADEIAPLKTQIQELQKDKQLETRLKANPKVQNLIQKEVEKSNKKALEEKAKLDSNFKLTQAQLKELQEKIKVNATKPIAQKDFNRFLSDSIRDLQSSFEDEVSNSNTDIIIRDIDIEATVITEMKNNKPVLVIPSREDMKTLGSNNFQKVKYSLSVIPKDTE